MKKLFVLAFCLGVAFTAKTVYASGTVATPVLTINLSEDEKTAVKPEELPEPIKKTLATDEYKGWAIQTASLVKTATGEHYEVSLANDNKEAKVVKFDKEGALLK